MNRAGVCANSGALMSSTSAKARPTVRSTTAIRSSAEANRTPWICRSTSAKTLAREKVERFSATTWTAMTPTSVSISLVRSSARSSGRSLRSFSVATHGTGSVLSRTCARLRQPSTCSGERVNVLVRPRLQGGSLSQPEHLGAVRQPAMGGDEVRNQRVRCDLDGGRPSRERLLQLLRDAGNFVLRDLGVQPPGRLPPPAQRLREEVGQDAVVHLGQAHRGAEHAPGVQRPPYAVLALGTVHHDHVRVQLRVTRA